MANKKKPLTLNEEIVLGCAFRYAIGRQTYVVSSVCEELQRHYPILNKSFKERIVKEINEHYKQYGSLGHEIDEIEWRNIQFLFDETNRVKIKANHWQSDIWDEVTAIKTPGGLYLSIPDLKEYHTVIELGQ